MIRVRVLRALVAGKLWRIAVLTAAAAIGTVSQAEAALYYWFDSDPGYWRPGPTFPQRRQKARHHQAKKTEASAKESTKPQGPLIIAISIQKQSLKIYDANGFFAETPISTGMRGHPTPMGVFSVIQKHRFHHSNIYSGAPMPFMQRITWSGVAMHAGVLPGYPASHGCIRMPTTFAIKMWNWTKMGARVLVTPGEITPASFSHPLLATVKVVPQPAAAKAPQTDAPPAAKTDKAADAVTRTRTASSEASVELRSTVGHEGSAPPAIEDVSIKAAGDASKADAKSETAKSEAEPTTAKPGETASSEAVTEEIKPGATDGKTPHEAKVVAQPSGDAAGMELSATVGMTAREAGETEIEAKAGSDKTEALKTDAKQHLARSPDIEKTTAWKPDPAAVAPPKRSGQIAVFISRKDSRLYARQNLAPLFDVPVTIAPSDRPLGTHVFTAQIDKVDTNIVRWSVVSLPVPAKYAQRRDEDERTSRRRKFAGAIEVKALPAPDSPAEALDRLTIPADAMARIGEALSTGGSIIVSDQGITAGETGEGTDFIVSLR
ncbi:L,D-transpeptidase family protein [Bradyrhizobium sp.]|jgi:lipoprotein-anchoring transpeptidase ErfK/SrfK|uniref:L,D-transpeptidase n=1 Tax=Bradyrhizobium sp. TaxID=376 RepID=UPI003C747161